MTDTNGIHIGSVTTKEPTSFITEKLEQAEKFVSFYIVSEQQHASLLSWKGIIFNIACLMRS